MNMQHAVFVSKCFSPARFIVAHKALSKICNESCALGSGSPPSLRRNCTVVELNLRRDPR
jgi:hypothetical protein